MEQNLGRRKVEILPLRTRDTTLVTHLVAIIVLDPKFGELEVVDVGTLTTKEIQREGVKEKASRGVVGDQGRRRTGNATRYRLYMSHSLPEDTESPGWDPGGRGPAPE